MANYSIANTLINRDGISREEAQSKIDEAREEVLSGAAPEEVLMDMGLEPDYIEELL